MQITLTIPDEIPQEIASQLIVKLNKQIEAAKRLSLKNSQRNQGAIKEKARQDLAQMVFKLRESAEEIGFVSEEDIVALIKDVRNEKPTPKFGSAKGLIKMSADFDEPLDDFADYM